MSVGASPTRKPGTKSLTRMYFNYFSQGTTVHAWRARAAPPPGEFVKAQTMRRKAPKLRAGFLRPEIHVSPKHNTPGFLLLHPSPERLASRPYLYLSYDPQNLRLLRKPPLDSVPNHPRFATTTTTTTKTPNITPSNQLPSCFSLSALQNRFGSTRPRTQSAPHLSERNLLRFRVAASSSTLILLLASAIAAPAPPPAPRLPAAAFRPVFPDAGGAAAAGAAPDASDDCGGGCGCGCGCGASAAAAAAVAAAAPAGGFRSALACFLDFP